MTAEAIVPRRGDPSGPQLVTPNVPDGNTGVSNVLPFPNPTAEISRIRSSTGLLQEVQRHVRHRPHGEGGLNRTVYVGGLLEACERLGEGMTEERVVAALAPSYGEQSYRLAHAARVLLDNAQERTAPQVEHLTPADELVVIGEADRVQRRVARTTGVDPSVFQGHELPADKVTQARWRKYGSIGLNAGSQAASFGVGWATKDYNLFDFEDKAASIAAAAATYVPLAGALIYYGKENLKQLKEKGINLVYLSKMLYERSLLKGGNKQEQNVEESKPKLTKAEKAAQVGYGLQEGGIEAGFLAAALAAESATFWAMSNLVSSGFLGVKILGSRWYRLGFNEGIMQPVVNVGKKLKRQEAASQ